MPSPESLFLGPRLDDIERQAYFHLLASTTSESPLLAYTNSYVGTGPGIVA